MGALREQCKVRLFFSVLAPSSAYLRGGYMDMEVNSFYGTHSLLRKMLDDISGKNFINIRMPGNLFNHPRLWIHINIMFPSMTDKDGSPSAYFFKQQVSFHAGILNTPVFLTCSFFRFASSWRFS